MLEIIVLMSILALFSVCLFAPNGYPVPLFAKFKPASSKKADEFVSDSLFHNPFLAQLQGEIEQALTPRPTDSVLARHYDAIVAVEINRRLAQMSS